MISLSNLTLQISLHLIPLATAPTDKQLPEIFKFYPNDHWGTMSDNQVPLWLDYNSGLAWTWLKTDCDVKTNSNIKWSRPSIKELEAVNRQDKNT